MNKVLIVVDYQKDFVDGALGFDYLETREGKNLPIPHCKLNTKGWELYGKVKEWQDKNKAKEVYKNTFGSRELPRYISEDIKEIHLVGLVSDICVFSNAVILQAFFPNVDIYIHKNATTSFDKEMEKISFKVLEHLHIKVI